ncbi:type II toxin-antitoxin system RelE/ParE family toxin [Candidatus Parcubacteria bacterium]|nr:type II toxin-antitoxin system RelE/ParE family toxin [Candidatus Parcubacteria bacterium]
MLQIDFTQRAEREFGKLTEKLQKKVFAQLKNLAEQGLPYKHIKKIQGKEIGYRLRVGRWRVLFALFSNEQRVEVVDIFLKKSDSDHQKRKNLLR